LLLSGLRALGGVRVVGLADPASVAARAPTVAILPARAAPHAVAARLAARGIFTWAGNSYALALSEALGLEPGGVVRVGLLHYNTAAEVERFLAELPACL
jgi:selenocysteine lyase/cysteine desulfurase